MFELLDEDSSQSISAEEFSAFGFLFNFHGDAVKQIFTDFDISGDQVERIGLHEVILHMEELNHFNQEFTRFLLYSVRSFPLICHFISTIEYA